MSTLFRPTGRRRLVVIDWKPEATPVGPPVDHRVPAERVIQAARAAGLSGAGSSDLLPNQHILFFSKLQQMA